MKKGYCDISIVLDRSGSMEPVKTDTIGGINAFTEDQKNENGTCKLSLYQFNEKYHVTYQNADISIAPRLNNETYNPSGWTALLDAIGKTIQETGKRLASLKESERPEKVIIVIQTDGFENKSTKFSRKEIFDMITHQQSKYNWQFVFLGANQDAIATANSYGISSASSLTYASNSIGTENLYKSVSNNLKSFRAGGQCVSFSSSDRQTQEEEINKSNS